MNKNIVPPTFEIVDVTPDLAHAWLGLNTANRRIKDRNVDAFARDMAEGRWQLNGESIKFTGSRIDPQKMLDGQNRCHAVIKAGLSVPMLVAFGIPGDSQKTMDSGAKRTVGDQLTINGLSRGTIIAAAAGVAWREQNGQLTTRSVRPTNAALEEFIYDNQDLIHSAEIAAKYARRADFMPSLVAYTHWRFSEFDEGAGTEFWMDAARKVGLRPGDPVIALTNWSAENRRGRRNWPESVQISAVFRAWNARRQNKTLSIIRVTSSKGGVIDIPKLAS